MYEYGLLTLFVYNIRITISTHMNLIWCLPYLSCCYSFAHILCNNYIYWFLTPSHYKLFHYYALHAFYFYSWIYLSHLSDLSIKLSRSSIWSALLITNKFLISSTTSSLTKFVEPILTEVFILLGHSQPLYHPVSTRRNYHLQLGQSIS